MLSLKNVKSPDSNFVNFPKVGAYGAVSPVTRGEMARNPGYSRIPSFNNELKKLAKKTGTAYFDYTSFLKDSSGYLKAVYAEGDGYHWKASAYTEFGKVVDKFDKSLDQ